jgi:hypothetical protein
VTRLALKTVFAAVLIASGLAGDRPGNRRNRELPQDMHQHT